MKKKKGKIMPFFKFLAIAMALITIITLCLFKFIDILPGEYFIVLCILLVLIDVVFSLLIYRCGRGCRERRCCRKALA